MSNFLNRLRRSAGDPDDDSSNIPLKPARSRRRLQVTQRSPSSEAERDRKGKQKAKDNKGKKKEPPSSNTSTPLSKTMPSKFPPMSISSSNPTSTSLPSPKKKDPQPDFRAEVAAVEPIVATSVKASSTSTPTSPPQDGPSGWKIPESDRYSDFHVSHGRGDERGYDPNSLLIQTNNNSHGEEVTIVTNRPANLHEDSEGRTSTPVTTITVTSLGSADAPLDLSNLKPRASPSRSSIKSTTPNSSLYPTIDSERSSISVSQVFHENTPFSASKYSSSSFRKQLTETRNVYYFEITFANWSNMHQLPSPSPSALFSIGLTFDLPLTGDVYTNKLRRPGESNRSIGLISDGVLRVNGRDVFISDTNCSDNDNNHRRSFELSDTIGCGIEMSGLHRIFFTKNGKVIVPPTRFHDLDIRSVNNYCFPSLGIRGTQIQMRVVANFGMELGRKPFRWNLQLEDNDSVSGLTSGTPFAATTEEQKPHVNRYPNTTSVAAAATQERSSEPSARLYPSSSAAICQINNFEDGDQKLPATSTTATATAAASPTSLYPTHSTIHQISITDDEQKKPAAVPQANFPLGKPRKSALEDDIPTAAQSMHLAGTSQRTPFDNKKKAPPPVAGVAVSPPNQVNDQNGDTNGVTSHLQQQQQQFHFGRPSKKKSSLEDDLSPRQQEQQRAMALVDDDVPTQQQQYHFGKPSSAKKKAPLDEDDGPPEEQQAHFHFGTPSKKKSSLEDDFAVPNNSVATAGVAKKPTKNSSSLLDDDDDGSNDDRVFDMGRRQQQQPDAGNFPSSFFGKPHVKKASQESNLQSNGDTMTPSDAHLFGKRSASLDLERDVQEDRQMQDRQQLLVSAAEPQSARAAAIERNPANPYASNMLVGQESLTLDHIESVTKNEKSAPKSEEDFLNAAIEESKRDSSMESFGILTSKEIEEIKENARTLRSLVMDDRVDVSILESILDCCRADQLTVKAGFEKSMQENEDQAQNDLNTLITLNDIVLDAIKVGEEKVKGSMKRHVPIHASSQQKPSLEIGVLVSRKDVFSLLCVLRAQHDKRLDAALALMKFARDDECLNEHNGTGTNRLRDEIRSFGGMHSLVTVFRTKGSSHELRVVAALAVAYVLPSFVESSSHNPLSLCLKIMECLRFLSTARPVTPNGERISREEMYKASAMGVTSFWINELAPVLSSKKNITSSELHLTSMTKQRSAMEKPQKNSGGVSSDQRQQAIELQELLEMTVSHIVHIERLSDSEGVVDNSSGSSSTNQGVDGQKKSNDSLFNWRYTLVEQVCAVDVARPIAVREGLLPLLVGWLKSKDKEKIHPAASALRYLTSIKDKYMAGWIHSQMVNEGALAEVVKLADDYFVGQDVRLAVAQILSSLCVAPHTRAAVVETKCINYLIGFLYEHSDQASEELALFAGSAITQLAEGAISRASVFGSGDMELLDFVSPDKRDSLVDDIVNGGAIASFVAIALKHVGKLRSMAIEAIRVLSEDTSPTRRTRLQLCEDGGAKALGRALKDNISALSTAIKPEEGIPDSSLENFHGVLCALANMLDPVHDGRESGQSNSPKPKDILIEGCMQTAESGGLSSLLSIVSLPLAKATPSQASSTGFAVNQMELLEEACRCLASLSPLLLSDKAAAKGNARWAGNLLGAFNRLLMLVGDDVNELDSVRELTINALLGLGALATYEPLKIRIVDQCLSSLVQLKNVRGDQTDVSNAASQVFLALGFADDEIAVQVAGSNPNLLSEWFCLQRSLVIQAMARSEARRILVHIWGQPFDEAEKDEVTKLIRQSSKVIEIEELEETYLFESFADDDDNSGLRDAMLRQYRDVYDAGNDSQNFGFVDLGEEARGASDTRNMDASLLSSHVYPLNKTQAEIDWILSHHRSISSFSSQEEKLKLRTSLYASKHVEKLLDYCFPSRLLRSHILPIFNMRPDTSFNFRALMMPQRRYFSFRREGQLVSRLCDKQAETLDSDDVYWTLGFTNSTFAGEFAETLVQALYLCPMIRGLSFVKNFEWVAIEEASKESNEGEDGGAFLANLACSLPPWINSLTFENIFSDRGLKTLVALFETMGKISAEQDTEGFTSMERKISSASQAQWKFWSFAIRRSPQVTGEAWNALFRLLGRADSTVNRTVSSPLSSLKSLDLSYNKLGDEKCATLLNLVYDRDSRCSLEQLDLSGNQIGEGKKVIKSLRSYVEYYRYNHSTAEVPKTSLHTLVLSSNDLGRGQAALEIVALLKYNILRLKVLDLSSNNLNFGDDDYQFSQVLVSSLLKNKSLCHLNLSRNSFSAHVVDYILDRITTSSMESGLAFLGFDENTPPLTAAQLTLLDDFVVGSRKVALQRYFQEKMDNSTADFSSIEAFSTITNQLPMLDEKMSMSGESGIDELAQSLGRDPSIRSIRWKSRSDSLEVDAVPKGDNMITVLFSAPLVYSDDQRMLRPFAKLDFEMERELMWQCLKEASRDIELSFDTATHDRLLAAMTKRCSCLHYSGHGHQSYLPFEDGSGGPNWFKVEDIKNLIAREGGAPFQFVFVSACHSGLAGETFASAGVPHVVCCQQESELKDSAALAFTRQFYLALAVGHTVKESFEQGCKAVRATPNLRDAEKEMKKFILLPSDGNHDVPVFRAAPVSEWPKVARLSLRSSRLRRGKSVARSSARVGNSGGAKSSELSVRNMMQEDPSPTPPQFFMGREVDMYHVLKAVLGKRLVSVVGDPGVGRSSLVCALCHYINERASTILAIDEIYFVKAKLGRRGYRCRDVIEQLLEKLVEGGKGSQQPEPGVDMEYLFDFICKSLKNEKALVVFDRVELLEGSDEEQDFPMLLSSLFRGTKHVKVLLTGRRTLGIPSLGGQVEHSIHLGPLNFTNTVRLFANLCPHLHTPAERRKLYEQLAKHGDQTDLSPSDPGITERTKHLFHMLGDGIPSNIEKAAYSISVDTLRELVQVG